MLLSANRRGVATEQSASQALMSRAVGTQHAVGDGVGVDVVAISVGNVVGTVGVNLGDHAWAASCIRK